MKSGSGRNRNSAPKLPVPTSTFALVCERCRLFLHFDKPWPSINRKNVDLIRFFGRANGGRSLDSEGALVHIR